VDGTSHIAELGHGEIHLAAPVMRTFYEEGNLPGEFDEDNFTRSMATLVRSGAGAVFIHGAKRKPDGGCGIILFPDLNTGDLIASETFWYVMPHARGGFAAVSMLSAMEDWARRNGAVRFSMSHLSGENSARIKRSYSRLGFREMETQFIKEL